MFFLERLLTNKSSVEVDLATSIKNNINLLLSNPIPVFDYPQYCQALSLSKFNFALHKLPPNLLTLKWDMDNFCQDLEQKILLFEPRAELVNIYPPSQVGGNSCLLYFNMDVFPKAHIQSERIRYTLMLDGTLKMAQLQDYEEQQ